MTKLNELYKCNICNNVVEIAHIGADSLVCCEVNMNLLEEKVDEPQNPHYISIEKMNDEIKISSNHPMTMEHYIQFIEIVSKNNKYIKRKQLTPNDKCELIVKCTCNEPLRARMYCNLHDLWRSKEING